eukprot:1283234-Alexandrium_andersonii.AAC.1
MTESQAAVAPPTPTPTAEAPEGDEPPAKASKKQHVDGDEQMTPAASEAVNSGAVTSAVTSEGSQATALVEPGPLEKRKKPADDAPEEGAPKPHEAAGPAGAVALLKPGQPSSSAAGSAPPPGGYAPPAAYLKALQRQLDEMKKGTQELEEQVGRLTVAQQANKEATASLAKK